MNERKLVLASSSPRRVDLLKLLGAPFTQLSPDVEESRENNELPASYALRNARLKAKAVLSKHPTALIIAADTIVIMGTKVLEKPKDVADAKRMLSELSGKTHTVISGVCVLEKRQETAITVETEVLFRKLSNQEIDAYIATGEPMDKAGAYGAQGNGAQFVKAIKGSYTNVVGLPLAELKEILLDHGFGTRN